MVATSFRNRTQRSTCEKEQCLEEDIGSHAFVSADGPQSFGGCLLRMQRNLRTHRGIAKKKYASEQSWTSVADPADEVEALRLACWNLARTRRILSHHRFANRPYSLLAK